MNFKNTGQMCMIAVPDPNNEDGFRYVDLGNYFIDYDGNKCLVTTLENAKKYSSQVKVPIYVRKVNESSN